MPPGLFVATAATERSHANFRDGSTCEYLLGADVFCFASNNRHYSAGSAGPLRADAQRLKLPFACPCFSLAWARKNTARAAGIEIAGLFIVGSAVLVIDHNRFAACLAGMMMFRCSGRLD